MLGSHLDANAPSDVHWRKMAQGDGSVSIMVGGHFILSSEERTTASKSSNYSSQLRDIQCIAVAFHVPAIDFSDAGTVRGNTHINTPFYYLSPVSSPILVAIDLIPPSCIINNLSQLNTSRRNQHYGCNEPLVSFCCCSFYFLRCCLSCQPCQW